MRTYDVSRARYLFGHRTVPGGTAGPWSPGTVAMVAGADLHGLAIASRSEVRAVRVGFGAGPSPVGGTEGPVHWCEVVEGAPVILPRPISAGEAIWLDRLDAHDGRLTLALATCERELAALPVDVAPESSIVIGSDEAVTDASESATKSLHLAPPRVATAATRKLSATLANASGTTTATATGYAIARQSRTREIVLTSAALAAATTLATAAQTAVAELDCAALDHALVVLAVGAGAGPITGRVVLR